MTRSGITGHLISDVPYSTLVATRMSTIPALIRCCTYVLVGEASHNPPLDRGILREEKPDLGPVRERRGKWP